MKDPIVEEVRKYRMEHTKRFNGDLHLICEDLREKEKKMKRRLVNPEPKPFLRRVACVAEEPGEYKTKGD